MSSAAAFCESPILDREWLDSAAWTDEHWYDFEPVPFYSVAEAHESHARAPVSVLINVDELFRALAEQWETETAYVSSIHETVLNTAYQRIIGLGPVVLPAMFRDLRETGRFWFWAFAAITGDNPVPNEELGDLQRMTERWSEWAKERGLLE